MLSKRFKYLSARDLPYEDGAKDKIVYEYILAAIVEWNLVPGSKLPEDALSDYFKVSRTIVRKVLHRLATEKMVHVIPNRGAYVAKPTVEEARDIFQIWLLLEENMLEYLQPDISFKLFDTIEQEIVPALLQAREDSQVAQTIILSHEFHLSLSQATKNLDLTSTLSHLFTRISLVLSQFHSNYLSVVSHQFYPELLHALKKKDPLLGAHLFREHITLIQALIQPQTPNIDTNYHKVFGNLKTTSISSIQTSNLVFTSDDTP